MALSSGAATDIKGLMRAPHEQFYANLRTTAAGLTAAEADRRLKEHGLNILPESKRVSVLSRAVVQFRNLFNVLLVFAAALSFFTGFTSHDSSSVNMGFAILLVVVASVLFSIFQEFRAERAVEALRQLVPANVRVQRDGKTAQIPVSRVVPGDVILLEEGDKIPADARLVSAFELSIDNSILTGESEPQPRYDHCATPEDCALEDITNLVFAGTTVASGSGTAVVVATGEKTRFGQVVGIASSVKEPLSPLQREINYTAKLNFVVAIGIGLLFLVISLQFLHLKFAESLLFMIGVMVSLVPEGLQVTLTLSLAISSLAMSRRNVVVKRLSSVETLGSTTVICTDKTGTITEGQMTVKKIWASGRLFDVSGEGYEPEGAVRLDGQKLRAADRKDLLALCETGALDNRATLVPPLDRRKYRWTAVGDSTDAALLVLAVKAGIDSKKLLEERPRASMIPFESRRKMMTSIHKDTRGNVVAHVKGAGNEVLSRCDSILWNDETIPLTKDLSNKIRSQIDSFAREAYRVIALAFRALPGESQKYEPASVEARLTFVGLVAILDPPRRDVAIAVQKARSAGIKIIMLTGDHELTADAIARQVGIITEPNPTVMSCEHLPEMSDAELSSLLDNDELVFARVTPEQKLRIVRLLKSKGETVAVTGDGVNDAPALLEADIGIAMGITGTDVARESADMVLLDDNFASIVSGVEVGRSVFDNLKKFIVYVFGHNWAELLTFIAFVLLQTPLPLAVVGVLAIDLVLEIPPSISLTTEPPEPGIMDRPPRSRSSRLFDWGTLTRSCYIGTIIGLAALFWCFNEWTNGGWKLGDATISNHAAYVSGTTVVIAAIMAGQLGNLLATRTNVRSAFSLSLARNRWLLPCLGAEIVLLLLIVYAPPLQGVFGTTGLPTIEWVLLFSIAPVILLLEEGRKYALRVRLPSAPMRVPAPVPLASFAFMAAAREERAAAPFVELGPPILVLSFSRWGTLSALTLAASLAEQSGSRLLIASDRALLKSQAEVIATECSVPCAYLNLEPSKGRKGLVAAAKAIRAYADKTGSQTIVVPVLRDSLATRRGRRSLAWMEELRGKSVLLISQPGTGVPRGRPRRILLPVLDEVHPEAFALAGALTASSHMPDVDVVAAKVIRMPPTIPLYSTYRPESLVEPEKELSFLKLFRGLPLLGRLTPKIVLVRNITRDLLQFAEDRRTDLIILKGDWDMLSRGFLSKKELAVAAKAPGWVAIVIPGTSGGKARG